MNIGFGKFGKSLKFKKQKWGIHGGDAAPVILLSALSQARPQDTIYLLSRSDLSQLPKSVYREFFPYQNVVDLYGKDVEIVKVISKYGNYIPDYKHLYNTIKQKNIHIDGNLLILGPTTSISIPNTFYKIRGSAEEQAIPISFALQYTAPIIYYLNMTQSKWIGICEDPRYFPVTSRDLFVPAYKTLGQYTETKYRTAHLSFEDKKLARIKEDVVYSAVETIFAMGEIPYSVDELLKKKNSENGKLMNLYLNQGVSSGALDRGPIVKEWVLDQFPNSEVKVHGKWNNPWASMECFTSTGMQDLIEEMEYTKYTLIIPIKKDWVTSKVWKMLHFGILPFFHPFYDTQKNIRINDFLRVNTPQEFKNKVTYLENNPDKYEQLLRNTMSAFSRDFYSGKTLLTNIYNTLFEMIGSNETYIHPAQLKIPISSFLINTKNNNHKQTLTLF